jgi:hypothetical protein
MCKTIQLTGISMFIIINYYYHYYYYYQTVLFIPLWLTYLLRPLRELVDRFNEFVQLFGVLHTLQLALRVPGPTDNQ